jgi:DNA-binding LacI/PurR family transcriptional regulator
MKRGSRRVTMLQIAQQARVSVGTVSHVINGTAEVRELLRQRVLSTIKRLGYRPSLMARALRSEKTTLIGMIVPDIANPFFPRVVRGAEDVLYKNSYRVMLCNADNDPEKEEVYFNELRAYCTAGLIVLPSTDSHLTLLAGKADSAAIPIVCVDRRAPGWKGDSVTVENSDGAYQSTRHLIRLGHRLMGVITGPMHINNAIERLSGFKRALREAGIKIPPEYIQEGRFDRLSGYEKALILLRFSPRPTAIVTANDLVALGVLSALRELRLHCPADVSVVGFDDQELAEFTAPSLTSVAQPAYQMGARAAELLLERIRGLQAPARQIVMQTVLQIRDSVAPPPSPRNAGSGDQVQRVHR